MDAVSVYEQAAKRGVRTFVTGPMMRLGRAAHAWDSLAATDEQWKEAVMNLKIAAATLKGPKLAIYPWGIQQEMVTRAESPQSMVLVVPNGRAKLLNALPFAVADLKTESLASAWPKVGAAWKSKEVQEFVRRAQTETDLLKHANECLRRSVSVWARRTKSWTSFDFQAAPTLGQAEASDSVLRSATANGKAFRSLARPLGTTSTID